MIIQITKQRPHRHFSAQQVAEDGSYIKRPRTLVVKFPKHCLGAAELGSVWQIGGSVTTREYKYKDRTIVEDLIEPKKPKLLRPDGELLATWISNNIAGVGITKARRLVRMYNANELDQIVLNDDIIKLSSITGISVETAKSIMSNWPTPAMWSALEFLQSSRLPMGVAKRLSRVYGDRVKCRLRTDPFILTAFGVCFEDILKLVKKLDIKVSEESLLAAISEKVTLAYGHKTGSTVVPVHILTEQAKGVCEELNVSLDKLIESALSKGSLIQVEAGYQLLGSAIQEASVGKFLARCANRKAGAGSTLASWERGLTDEVIENGLLDFERTLPFTMTAEQRAAVIDVVKSNVAVISGGAGTGKTTILLAVISLYESISNGMAMSLVALSGRAAQRMAEATGREAMTIAKLVANHTGDNKPDLPEHMLLVVDEASMMDLLSAYRLVGLLPYSTRIILVGDVAQLPPVGQGLVFHSVMLSDLPVFELTQVKRQGATSGIHLLASGIRNSEYYESMLHPSTDDVFYTADASENSIMEAYLNGGGPERAIVLTPTRKGPLGVKAINTLIQSCFDDEQPPVLYYQDPAYGWIRWVTASDSQLRLGDQVIVTANDYEEDIRNGDLGTITEVYSENQNGCFGVVNIDGHDVEINQAVLEKLELGYAITIHKSQGSQWPTCLFLLPNYAKHMLDQTLLYTAITRPSEDLVILGDKSLIQSAVERGSSVYGRTTNLLTRLAS